MEIHILLAGEQIGPFSEGQVRKYIDEGLVTPSDLATYDGMEDWQPIDTVLANLPRTPAPSARETGSLTEPFLALAAKQRAKRKSKTGALPNVTASALQEETPIALPPTTAPPVLRDAPGKFEPPLVSRVEAPKEPPKLPVKPIFAPAAKPVVVAAPKMSATPISAPTTEPVSVAARAAVESRNLPGIEHVYHAEDEAFFPRLLRYLFFGSCGLAVLIVCGLFYFIYRASTPHDAGHHGVLLKPDAIPVPNATAALTNPVPATAGNPTPATAEDFANRGIARKKDNDVNGAMADFNRALELDPNNAIAAYNRGLIRQEMGDLNGAMTDFTTTIASDPKNAHAFNNRGYIKQMLNDLDGAVADYGQAVYLDPKNSIAYYNLGLIRIQQGDLDGAIAAFNLALDNNPNMAIVYYKRGNVKNSEGNLEGAIADYTQAIVLNPKDPLAYCDRGFARQTKGDLPGALADYTEALALDDKLALVYYNRCLVRVQLGDLDGAIDDSTHAILLDNKNGAAYCNRGLARFGKGDYTGALDDLRMFCRLSPRDGGADRARLYAWIAAKRLNPNGTADQDLSMALESDWNSPPEEFTSKIANYLLGHIRADELIANAASPDETIEPGQYCRAWYFVGIKHRQAGDINTAVRDFQKCLATNQTNFPEYLFAKAELKAINPTATAEAPKAAAAATP